MNKLACHPVRRSVRLTMLALPLLAAALMVLWPARPAQAGNLIIEDAPAKDARGSLAAVQAAANRERPAAVGAAPAPAVPAVAAPSAPVTASVAPTSANPAAQVQINPAQIAPEWRIVQADATVSGALQRWATQANHQVVWQAAKDLPAYAATYRGSFESAVEGLMSDTRHSGYPLHACLYDNKVVRVLHVTQSCGQ